MNIYYVVACILLHMVILERHNHPTQWHMLKIVKSCIQEEKTEYIENANMNDIKNKRITVANPNKVIQFIAVQRINIII